MNPQQRLLQRDLDGALPRSESAAVAGLAAADPTLTRIKGDLLQLDADLKRMSVLNPVADEADARAQIMAALPLGLPTRHVQVRPIDVVYAMCAVALVVIAYGALAIARHTILEQTAVLVWLVGLSLLAGLALVLAPGFLRSCESGLLARVLGRPVAIGAADALVYRAVGASLVIGGLWLSW